MKKIDLCWSNQFLKGFLILIFMSLAHSVFSQAIKGKVIDEDGLPLPGAMVLIKGTTVGTQTDATGNFNIVSKVTNPILLFSFIGYLNQEILVNKRTIINVQLKVDNAQLTEVVVIGYGTAKKSDLTGSIVSVSADDLSRGGINPSFANALDGLASGVKVNSGEGSPGGGLSIQIRGGTSISASNEPLYVVDGFPITDEKDAGGGPFAGASSNALASINPNDIESIQILKDASATAIYGSRGANGVVIITTKTGQKGKTIVSFENSLSSKIVSDKLDILNSVQYAQYRKTQNAAAPTSEIYLRFENPESFAGTGTDWQDEVYRTAYLKNYNLGISGGSDKIKYNGSLGAFLDEGIIAGSSFNRYNGRINLRGDISSRARFTSSITGSYALQQGAPTGGSNGERAGGVSAALFYPPVIPLSDDPLDDLTGNQTFNPLSLINETTIENKTNFLLGNLSLEYDISKDLMFKVLVGGNSNNVRQAAFYTSNTGYGALTNGRSQLGLGSTIGWVNENTLTYNKKIDKHSFNLLGGYTLQASSIESFNTVNTNFNIQDLGFNRVGLGTTPEIPVSNSEDWALMSGLGRLNYGYDSRYLLTFSFRADGSSRFAEGNKWGYFPAAAAAWRISEEKFLKNSKIVSDLKLRVGYGVTGNQEIPRYRSLSSIGTNFYGFGLDNNLSVAGYVDRVANPDLTWETTKQTNLGVDFGIFNNRLSATVDVYSKLTTNLLLQLNLVSSSGIAAPALKNVGSIKNEGLEISLKSINLKTKSFSWSTDFNISFNRNKILDLGPSFDQIYADVAGGNHGVINEVILKPGQSIGTFFGFQTNGINPLPANATPAQIALAGTTIFVDQDGNGVINDLDRINLGNALPKNYGGINNQFNYKGVDLGIFFNWSYGNKVYNSNRVYTEGFSFDGRNKSTAILNAWTPENQNTTVPAIGKSGFDDSRFIDKYIEDGSFLRLKNISIGYTLDKKLLKIMPFSSLRINISGQNLWTLTNYTGYNPEGNISRNPVAPGIDWGAYPLSKIYTLGLNVKF